jgi:O-antigen/teichoic acid export membrane protein
MTDMIFTRISWRRLKIAAIHYRDFPLYNMPATFLVRFSARLPVLVLVSVFSPEIAGFYAMADRLVRMPLGGAGNAIRNVYLQRIAVIRNRGDSLRAPLVKTTLGLLVLGILPFGFIWYFGAEFLIIILGEQWTDSGRYVQILAPWYFVSWVNVAAQPTLTVLRRQSLWLRLQIGVLLARVMVFAGSYAVHATSETMLGLFAAANVVMGIMLLLVAFSLVWKVPNRGYTAD